MLNTDNTLLEEDKEDKEDEKTDNQLEELAEYLTNWRKDFLPQIEEDQKLRELLIRTMPFLKLLAFYNKVPLLEEIEGYLSK